MPSDSNGGIPPQARAKRRPGHGAVAIIAEQAKFLVIRRSRFVRAPNLLCFAGGSIESGESPEQAIERELQEELALIGTAKSHIWQSRTSWGTKLEWVLVDRHPESDPIANPEEVAEWMWLGGEELLRHPDLLPSVPDFFRAWSLGQFELPSSAGAPDPSWREL